MDTEKLLKILSAFHPLTDEFKQAVSQEAQFLSLPRNYFLLEPPRFAEFSYFLCEGYAMSFYFAEGRKQVQTFWCPESFILTGRSFFEKIPSTEFIQLITPAEVICFSYESTIKLLDSFPEANFLYRAIMTRNFEKNRERIRELQKMQVKERYQKLREQIYGIEQLVTQAEIATYLGITPQSLSRMKKRTGRD